MKFPLVCRDKCNFKQILASLLHPDGTPPGCHVTKRHPTLNMELQRSDIKTPFKGSHFFLPHTPKFPYLAHTIPCLDTLASPPIRTHQPPGQRLRHRIPQQTALPQPKPKTLPTRCTRVPGLLPLWHGDERPQRQLQRPGLPLRLQRQRKRQRSQRRVQPTRLWL